MSRVAALFATLRGWAWLCAALALVPLVPFAMFIWRDEHEMRARVAAGGFACGTGYVVFLALYFALACGLGLLVALLGAGSFLRLPAPRARARRWELLLAASAPLALPALYFVVMAAADRIAAW